MERKLDVGALAGVSNLNTADMQVQQIPLALIDESQDNRYDQRDIDELAESIEVIGLQQPLVVQAEGERYRLIAGHRRRNALALLARETAPCIVLAADLDPAIRTLILHWTNTMARGGAGLKGDALAGAAKEIEAALLDLKKRGAVELPGKLREYVAGLLQVSESAVARAKAIDAHLIQEWKDIYGKNCINDSVAYELSQCDAVLQRKLHAVYKSKTWQLDAKKVKTHKKAAEAGFAPLVCPKSEFSIDPCIGTDKRAAAVKRGECPGCCHDCVKADGCEWVCGVISKQLRARAEAAERSAEHERKRAEYEASAAGKMQAHLRQTLEHFGVTAPADLGEPLKYRTSWIFADDPTRYRSPDVDDLFTIADQIGVDLQELLLGNPDGAPLRTLDEQMRQAVAEPQPAAIWHLYPAERPADGQTVLTRKSTGYYSALMYRDGSWFLPGFADSEMDVHVDWWSAELAPEEDENEK